MRLIPLTKGKFAKIDDEDYQAISKHKWYAQIEPTCKRIYYADRDHFGKHISMHRILMDAKPGEFVDHIDGDGLNNQKSNLMVTTNRGNQQNLHYLKSSRYPGVTWHKKGKKWCPKIQIKGIQKHLGSFNSEFEAFKAYVVANVVLL